MKANAKETRKSCVTARGVLTATKRIFLYVVGGGGGRVYPGYSPPPPPDICLTRGNPLPSNYKPDQWYPPHPQLHGYPLTQLQA